jgi:peptide/nickel transport system ATP-binding protein
MAYLFISHDISTVEAVADRVVVLYQGRVCEVGAPARVFHGRQHPYTALLQASVPTLDPGWLDRTAQPTPALPAGALAASGCVFRARCSLASEVCAAPPPPRIVGPGHVIYCHKAIGELTSAA